MSNLKYSLQTHFKIDPYIYVVLDDVKGSEQLSDSRRFSGYGTILLKFMGPPGPSYTGLSLQ